MSRNQDRLGLDTGPSQTETPAATTAAVGLGVPTGNNAPTFSWSVPTEFVELPSEGVFYHPEHPLHNQKTVEIRFMTAKEEDILTSRSLLKEGVALDRMLQNILIDKSIDVNSLLVGDKNALLVAARRTGYGPEYSTSVTCPACLTQTEYTFDISEPPFNNYAKNAEEMGIIIENGVAIIDLPMSNVRLGCRFLTGADETKLAKEMDRKVKRKMDSSTTTDAFRSFIVSVNGDDNLFTVETFIHAMPARDARHLRTIYNKVVPNIDLSQDFSCTQCGHEAEMEVPLGVDFFWPK